MTDPRRCQEHPPFRPSKSTRWCSGEVTLWRAVGPPSTTSTRGARWMRPDGFAAAGELIAARALELGAEAVGGLRYGGDPALLRSDQQPSGAGLVAFFVRGERKEHGLQRWSRGWSRRG